MWWAAVVLVVVLASLGIGLWLALRAGGADERADQARRDADESDEIAERMAGPTSTQRERARAARRELRRRGVRVVEIETAVRRAADRRSAGDPER